MDVLINRIACKLTNLICINTTVKETDDEKIRYALIVIINELVKIIILSTIFFCIGKLNYYVFSMVILLTLRTFSGGVHYNSSFECLVVTILFFIITCIVFVDYITIPIKLAYLIIFISLILIIIFSPCPNPKRPIRHNKRRWYLKIISIFLSILVASILLFLKNEKLLYCGTITMFLQSLQLIHGRKELF